MACSWAIAPVCAQDISQIAKSDPLIITGSIGTNNTYFHSSAGLGYMSPLSNSFFANLNFNIYGFSMPFSIYFSNDNLNFSYPQFSFNLSPSYKNFTAHIGQSSMPFSQYVLNMSFNGVGLEWRDKQFRASAFYGVLRRAVNDNPDDPTARIPQYRRYGWGISAGYSKGGNSIDLYFLRAYDSESSIDERWRTRVRPQENLVLGLKGQLSYKNFLSLAANVATSAFTADRESQQVMTDEARRFDKIFETRYTSRLRFAGDATLGLTLKGFNASIFYKYIQPDYVSLGTYYTSNNYHTLGLSAGTTLFRRLTLSASFSGQEDNLAKQQLYTTRGYVYNAMASLRVSDRMNVTAMYNGYLQSQGDGTAQVNDTTEIHRVLHSFSLVPTYNLPGELFDHTISLDARTNVGLSLPYELFAFAKNTGNQSYDIGDIHAHAQSFVQLALGHSRQIDDRLRVGAKMKLLFGVARADAEIKDLRADLSGPDKWTMTGQAMANVSMKGFTYKEEQKEYKVDGQGTYRRVNDVDVDGAGLGGFGMAFDFGATYKIDDDWTVSAALLDLGFIGWSNNMQAVNRQTSFEFNGFHDVAVKKEDAMGNPKDNSLESQGDRYADQIADFANLSSDGDKGSRSTGIGATMNFGCEYTLPAYRQLKFGFLSSTRINGKYSWTDARLSANVAPLSWLDGGMSFSVNSFTASMGWVINAHPKGFNFFIGMDHILGKTSKEFIPLSSNASLNLGMNVTF